MLRALTLVGALIVSLCGNTSAYADIRIINDPGGEVSAYVQTYKEVRASGQRVVIDGPCLSACTLLTGIVPRDRVCITQNAELGFHSASYLNYATGSLQPTRKGTALVMKFYPAKVRAWIERQGGLTPKIMFLRGRELKKLYAVCPSY